MKTITNNIVIFIFLVFFLPACAPKGDDSTTTTSTSSDAEQSFPSGFAVSSLTAASTPASSPTLFLASAASSTISNKQSFSEKTKQLKSIVDSTSDMGCKITLPDMTVASQNPTCYGPKLDYEKHLDGTDDTTLAQLPSGDLGIWTATESDGTACTAAKINSSIDSIATKVDGALLYMASAVCTMKVNNKNLPTTGTSSDITSLLSSAISANNSSSTVSTATVEQLAKVGSNSVYKYTITSSNNGNEMTVYMKHVPTSSDNTTYKGKIWSKIATGGGNSEAFSILYEKTSSKVNYQMVSASYQPNATQFFDASGDLKINGDWSGNISKAIVNIDASNGLGSTSYAWQAGTGDDKTRVFNAYTKTSGSDIVGYGFFGYGASRFDNSTGSSSDNVISTFICNWAGPGNNHSGMTGKAQKQFMKKDSTGKFVPDSAIANPDLIDYAPVNSCDMTSGETSTFNGGAPFRYKLTTTGSFPSPQPAVSNELVDLTSDSEYSAYTAPSAPTNF